MTEKNWFQSHLFEPLAYNVLVLERNEWDEECPFVGTRSGFPSVESRRSRLAGAYPTVGTVHTIRLPTGTTQSFRAGILPPKELPLQLQYVTVL
jgi:hypothetical protein